jgi:hypothetical protein
MFCSSQRHNLHMLIVDEYSTVDYRPTADRMKIAPDPIMPIVRQETVSLPRRLPTFDK